MCAHVCEGLGVCACVCVWVHVDGLVCGGGRIGGHVRVHVHVSVCVCACICVCECVRVHVYARVWVYGVVHMWQTQT